MRLPQHALGAIAADTVLGLDRLHSEAERGGDDKGREGKRSGERREREHLVASGQAGLRLARLSNHQSMWFVCSMHAHSPIMEAFGAIACGFRATIENVLQASPSRPGHEERDTRLPARRPSDWLSPLSGGRTGVPL
ncbi:MAG: hypothetical protein A49_04490 [Methyloceanibacter sp.]|nr:MAG: hypothetical protein A49_04490 [Methyloceanibacter sp.]